MSEEEKAYKVCNVESFGDLKKVMDEIGEVMGSRKPYSPERLKEKIKQIRACGMLTLMTRTYGLRAKVAELMYYEKNNI